MRVYHFYTKFRHNISLVGFSFSKIFLIKISPMQRYYAKHESSIDFSVVLEAVKQIKIHKKSIRSVSEFNYMSHATLALYMKKINFNLFLFHFFL